MPKLKLKLKTKRVTAFVLTLAIIFTASLFAMNIFKDVYLTDGEREIKLRTYSTSTESILSKAQVSLQYADEVKRHENNNDIYINVLRAFPVLINYREEPSVVMLTGGTVEDALDKADIVLNENDVCSVPITTDVYKGMSVDVDEVTYSKKTVYSSIEFDTSFEYSDDFPKGYEEIKVEGKDGAKQITTTYRYVNGELEGESGKIESITDEPVTQVVLKGTAQSQQVSNIGNTTHSSGAGSGGVIEGLSYSRVLTGSATAYTASAGALTATGVPVYVGGVAVNPDVIPYGSKLYIVADGYTYGYATAVDTGGALMSGSALVDLYMSSYDECINFGRRNVTVYVLN